MGNIGAYLFGITVSALLCSTLLYFLGDKGGVSSAIKLLCGIIMAVSVLSPWVDVDFSGLLSMDIGILEESQHAAAMGEFSAQKEMTKIITEKTQAYILDKAESLGASLNVTVHLTEDLPPIPCGVRLQGSVSPYGKQVLTDWITKELNIPREAQEWS